MISIIGGVAAAALVWGWIGGGMTGTTLVAAGQGGGHSASGQASVPVVIASIPPVHSLVAGVMAGIGEPRLLIAGGQSPHTFALRPSDAAALQAAEVVFWIGAGLETVLDKPLQALAGDARVVALAKSPGLTLLAGRSGGAWAGHDHGEGHEDGHDDGKAEAHGESDAGHDHADHGQGGEHADHADHEGSADMHIWLSPANARAMVGQIVTALSAADPGNAGRYQANGADLDGRLAALDATLEQDLAPLRDRAYVVFHDAYQYFENRYRLTPAGSITVSPDRAPGAATLAEIRTAIRDRGAVCVFAEPQFEPALVRTVTEGSGARTGVLDPLGAGVPPGPEAYFTLINNLSAALSGCLKPGS